MLASSKKHSLSLAYIKVYARNIPDGLLCGFALMYLRAEEEDLCMVRMGLIYGDDCTCNVHSHTLLAADIANRPRT